MTEACIELGALAYDNWTAIDGGGSGLPAGESNVDYLRCKSCHGWDRLGEFGGYVRRTRTADRPNAGLGDLNDASRYIAPGLGSFFHIDADQVLHEGAVTGAGLAARAAVHARYRDGLGMPIKAKYWAIGMMAGFSLLSIVVVRTWWFALGITTVALIGIWYVGRKVPTTPADLLTAPADT